MSRPSARLWSRDRGLLLARSGASLGAVVTGSRVACAWRLVGALRVFGQCQKDTGLARRLGGEGRSDALPQG